MISRLAKPFLRSGLVEIGITGVIRTSARRHSDHTSNRQVSRLPERRSSWPRANRKGLRPSRESTSAQLSWRQSRCRQTHPWMTLDAMVYRGKGGLGAFSQEATTARKGR
jgi:hypothetical protein